MENCANLCTAAKCQELEDRIVALEEIVSQLQDSIQVLTQEVTDLTTELTEHLDTDMSLAHSFDIYFRGNLSYSPSYKELNWNLEIWNFNGDDLRFYNWYTVLPFVPQIDFDEHLNTSIPDAHDCTPLVLVDVTYQNDGSNTVKVTVDEQFDEATFGTEPLGLNITENTTVNGKEYDFEVSLGNKTANDTLILDNFTNESINDYFNNLDFFFRIDDLPNNDYDFVLTIGDRTRSQRLDLASSGGGGSGTTEPPPITVSMNGSYDAINNNLNISTTVNGSTGTTVINLEDMTFTEIMDCLAQIKQTLEEEKELETVTIVASPEVQANVKDTLLVLDFTTVEAFPGLNATNSKWRVQIPAPKAHLTWDDLKDIRWFRGGQYGKVKFAGRQNYTAGWFKSKGEGESYFNQIDNLTTLTVDNIIFPQHTNPKISPAEIETRVYRAFKVFVGSQGEPNNELTQVLKPPAETP